MIGDPGQSVGVLIVCCASYWLHRMQMDAHVHSDCGKPGSVVKSLAGKVGSYRAGNSCLHCEEAHKKPYQCDNNCINNGAELQSLHLLLWKDF